MDVTEPAPPGWAPALAAIHREAFGAESWSEESLATLLDSPFVIGLIQEGGFILARAVAGEAEILTLAVLPDRRRQGIGRALLEAALQQATQRHADHIFLEVDAANAAALALYRAAGFVEAGTRPDYYGPGQSALLLSRRLVPA